MQNLFNDILGRHCRAARHAKGASLNRVARRTGMTKQYVSQLERGSRWNVYRFVTYCYAIGIAPTTVLRPALREYRAAVAGKICVRPTPVVLRVVYARPSP